MATLLWWRSFADSMRGRVSLLERIRGSGTQQRALAHASRRLWNRAVHNLGVSHRFGGCATLRIHNEPVALRVWVCVCCDAFSAATVFHSRWRPYGPRGRAQENLKQGHLKKFEKAMTY